MNKLARLQLIKQALALDYLRKQAALDELYKQARNVQVFGDIAPLLKRITPQKMDPVGKIIVDKAKLDIHQSKPKSWEQMLQDMRDYIDTGWKSES
jgi:hypothetical protein